MYPQIAPAQQTQFQPFMQYPMPPESDNKALVLATIAGGAVLVGILWYMSTTPAPETQKQASVRQQPPVQPPGQQPAAQPAAAPQVRPAPITPPRPTAPTPASMPRTAPPGLIGQHIQAQYRDGKWYGGTLQKGNLSDPDAVKWDAGTVPASMNPSTGTSPAQAVRVDGGVSPGATAGLPAGLPDFGALLGSLNIPGISGPVTGGIGPVTGGIAGA